MTTSDRCLARAEEAERLAALVSYSRDRERLHRQAAEWRAKAAELEMAGEPETALAERSAEPLLRRLIQRFRRVTT